MKKTGFKMAGFLPTAALFLTVLLVFPAAGSAKTEIQWWHAMTGFLGEKVVEIVNKFNASQNEFEIKAVAKGSYPEDIDGRHCGLPGEDASPDPPGL